MVVKGVRIHVDCISSTLRLSCAHHHHTAAHMTFLDEFLQPFHQKDPHSNRVLLHALQEHGDLSTCSGFHVGHRDTRHHKACYPIIHKVGKEQ
jgi:hypothetical protein